MATSFQLVLDTTGPQGVTASLNGGVDFASSAAATLAASTTDADTTGYQMKVWGDLSGGPADEASAAWQTYNPALALTLSSGDGVKTVFVKLRDDVWNESAVASDSLTLDQSAPTPNVITGPTPAKVSKIAGKDVSSITWTADQDFEEYHVKVVPSLSSDHTQGVDVPVDHGSTNTSGSAGGYVADTPITTEINGADLEEASPGDGGKIIKIFVREASGNWSV